MERNAPSVASYKVDKALGTAVLARTRFAACSIKDGAALFGSLQDWTDGVSINKMQNSENGKAELQNYTRSLRSSNNFSTSD